MPSSSRRTRERQLAKLAARRAAERRRRRRQRIMVMGLALAVATAGVGGGLLALLGGDEQPAAEPSPTETPGTSPTPGTNGECGYVQSAAPAGPEGAIPVPELTVDESRDYRAVMRTSMGRIELDLFEQHAPCAVNSFVYLAERGYYDGLTFHRVVRDFVVQGGDPTGTGSGGPGYTFNDELDNDLAYGAGTLAMANSGPNTNGSQFFIVASETGAQQLQKLYTIFGEVTRGMDVVRAINRVETVGSGDNPDQPVEPVVIESLAIEVGETE